MTTAETNTNPELFFDYHCDACGEPYCERVYVMNLTLGNTEDAFCLDCLADEHDKEPKAMAQFCWGYVQARDCFKKPWSKFDASPCPKQKTQQCFCQLGEPA